jgi:Family of unknown function (DUF5681)
MANRNDKGNFRKGASGNPGGRPKLPAEIREMFQARSQEALEVLTRCLQSDDERIARAAAQAILDRGYGRPTQSIEASVTGKTHEQWLDEMSQRVEVINQRKAEGGAHGSEK